MDAGLACHWSPYRDRRLTRSIPRLVLKPVHAGDFIACSYRIDSLLFSGADLVIHTLALPLRHMRTNGRRVGREPGHTQCAPEGAPPFRQCETTLDGVQPCPSSRQPVCRVGHYLVSDQDHTQKICGHCPLPATHARANRTVRDVNAPDRTKVT
ncbi:hypothetical protein GCM10009765_33440 [Fodinicola feengrottensis]|uniref:Uncharacterized protein n=1 Tax=Fodinicola feengrottensis TaxID=435914 RepID=A0ABP4T3G5_9ACTN